MWFVGAASVLGATLGGLIRAYRVRRDGVPWYAGQAIVNDVAGPLRMRRRIQLLLDETVSGPMTCGIVRPTIVLPPDARLWNSLDLRRAIAAKSPVRITSDSQREMLRALLAERFGLVAHTETHELPIYALALNRSDGRLGPRLAPFKTDCAAVRAGRIPSPPPSSPQRPVCNWTGGTGYFAAGRITMSTFAEALSLRVDRAGVDRTGLTDSYEFDLSYNPGFVPTSLPPDAPPIDPESPVLFTALREQLGLKLDPTVGPVSVLVIDSIQRRPTEN